MRPLFIPFTALVTVLVASGCSSDDTAENRGEHARDTGEHGGQGGSEGSREHR